MGKVLPLNDNLFKLRARWNRGHHVSYKQIANILAGEQKELQGLEEKLAVEIFRKIFKKPKGEEGQIQDHELENLKRNRKSWCSRQQKWSKMLKGFYQFMVRFLFLL